MARFEYFAATISPCSVKRIDPPTVPAGSARIAWYAGPPPRRLRDLGPVAQTLARLESLDAHANAVTVRLDALAQSGHS